MKLIREADAPLLLPYPAVQLALGGVHRETIKRLIKAGKLVRVKIGRRTLITRASVLALAQSENQPAE
jgi:excisionase family DNA binding protein